MRKDRCHNYTAHKHILAGHIDDYLHKLSARRYSQKTVASHRFALRKFVAFMDANGIARLQDVNAGDITNYQAYLFDARMSDSTVSQYLCCLRSFLAHLEATSVILINPASELVVPRTCRKIQPVPNEDEMRQVLMAPDTTIPTGIRDRALMETAYSTAARLGELIAMDVKDVDLAGRTARISGKGGKHRVVPVGSNAAEWIARYVHESRRLLLHGRIGKSALWIGRWGRRIHPVIVQKTIRDYRVQAGIEMRLTPHSIRRAAATHMLRNGAHPVQIQLLLGHSSLRNLSQYLRVTITDLKKMHCRSKPGQ